jgi:hypothetical protein
LDCFDEYDVELEVVMRGGEQLIGVVGGRIGVVKMSVYLPLYYEEWDFEEMRVN